MLLTRHNYVEQYSSHGTSSHGLVHLSYCYNIMTNVKSTSRANHSRAYRES